LCEIAPLCASYPCANNGTCLDISATEFECVCVVGAAGAFCEEDIDDCASADTCDASGTSSCEDLGLNSYVCNCLPEWTGDACQFSEEATFDIVLLLETDEDAVTFAEDLEAELTLEFPDIELLVIAESSEPAAGDETMTVWTFSVFYTGQEEALPNEADIAEAVEGTGVTAQLVYVEGQAAVESAAISLVPTGITVAAALFVVSLAN
jgi:hypothetical protein